MYKTPPRRILIVCTRRLGDVLLVTPLIRTCKRHWPNTQIDLLVFQGTEAILAANTDIHRIITIAEHPKLVVHYHFIKKIFHAYDLSISTLPGDRSTLYAFFAAPYRIGMLGDDKSRWWKSLLLSDAVEFDNLTTHTVIMNLRLAEILQLTPYPEIVLAWDEQDVAVVTHYLDIKNPKKLAILHIFPKFSYKAWVKQAWIQLAHWLQQQDYSIVFTGDKTQAEQEGISEILQDVKGDVLNLVGSLSLNQLAFLLSHSQIYIGPDTVVTHMAAALGVPTVALFGPTNPVKWGPWPKTWGYLGNPFLQIGSQQRHNVYLMQGPGMCVPCLQEGCDRHVKSRSRCLEDLTAQEVINAVSLIMSSSSLK
jgi:heptosyltransferase III